MGFAYRIASPSEYLAITGYGIDDVKLAKKVWVAPGQHCTRFDISPVNYTFEVQAMSAEKISFILPAVIVVGPQADDMECLLRYAKLISPLDKLSDHVNGLVKGVIEGEVRVLAASMTMEQIFQNTKSFKRAVFESVQLELNMFGLLIYNLTVKQLMDVPGHDYFSYQGQKMFASEREAEGNARLAMNKAGLEHKVKVAEVEAHMALAIREAEQQGEVERANAARETEKLKAEHLSKAIVDYEMKVQQANWELYGRQKAAEALLFEQEKEAEARRASADAAFFARQREAEAEFYAKQKEAEGLMAMGKAHGAYLVATHALGGSYGVEGIEPMTVLGVNGRATADGGSGTGGDDSATARVHQMLASVHQQTARLPTTWKILVRALVYAFFVLAVYIRINYQ